MNLCGLHTLWMDTNNQPVNTFTIGFDNQVYNEAIQAKLIANHLGTQHHELYVSAEEARSVIPNLQNICL